MKAVITITDEDEPGKISASVDYGTAGMTDRSAAHKLAAGMMGRFAFYAKSVEQQQHGAALQGAKVTEVSSERIAETLGQPVADDAHVAIGSTRFSDGQIQTQESQDRARERVTIGAGDVGTMPPGIIG